MTAVLLTLPSLCHAQLTPTTMPHHGTPTSHQKMLDKMLPQLPAMHLCPQVGPALRSAVAAWVWQASACVHCSPRAGLLAQSAAWQVAD